MKLISSKGTYFSKKVIPVLWFSGLLIVAGGAILDGTAVEDPTFLLAPIFMIVVGAFLMYFLIWDLADEVLDGGDYLVFKRGSQEERIALTNVMNVNVSNNSNPPRITLRLVTPGEFGTSVAFLPARPFSLNPFAKNPIGEELIVRVDKARSKRAA